MAGDRSEVASQTQQLAHCDGDAEGDKAGAQGGSLGGAAQLMCQVVADAALVQLVGAETAMNFLLYDIA